MVAWLGWGITCHDLKKVVQVFEGKIGGGEKKTIWFFNERALGADLLEGCNVLNN